MTRPIEVRLLGRADVEALCPSPAELQTIVETGLAAHGRGEVVLPPKAHLVLDDMFNGHFNILPAWVGPIGGPVDRAGVKVVGDYVDNWRHGLPSEVGVFTLYEPRTGVPLAIMDATASTWWRTGAVTAAGVARLARQDPAVVAHIGARGSAFSNLRQIATVRTIRAVRINSKRRESAERLAARVRSELGLSVEVFDTAAQAVEGADVIVEATRLEQPEVLIPASAVKPGALVVTYGWKMATDPLITQRASKIVVDDWAQCTHGGALHPLIASGWLTRDRLHAEIGEIVAGRRPGREAGDDVIVYWHRGFGVSDVVLGHAIYERALARGRGQTFRLLDAAEE